MNINHLCLVKYIKVTMYNKDFFRSDKFAFIRYTYWLISFHISVVLLKLFLWMINFFLHYKTF